MNFDQLTRLAEEKIQTSEGSLQDFRQTHLALLRKNGFRETSPDSYKFTRPERFFSEGIDEKIIPLDEEGLRLDLPTIVFKDGKFLSASSLPEGISLKKTFDHFEEVKNLFTENNTLSSFHHVLSDDGVIVEVKKNTNIEKPIHLLHLISSAKIFAPSHIIMVGANSKLTLIEETRSFETEHTIIGETYILTQEGSQVEHIYLEEGGIKGSNHSSLVAELAKDSVVRSVILHGRGKLNRKNLILNLNAPGAHAESYALYLTSGAEHSDIHTTINHKMPDTTSDQIAKGILDAESKGIFTGKIHIHPKAQRVSSGQLNKNLLLSKKAQVHSQPQLEIFADDVKCSHGSTTGQLSDDEVFYFQARGIPEDRARTILALGFGLEIVQKIHNSFAREHVSKVIKENLSSKFSLEKLL